MARPKKEGMDYFPHDTDAVNDEKIEALRLLYGNDGYAFYFILLERIYRTSDFELDISDEETLRILAKKVDVPFDRFNAMLQTAIKRECFDAAAYEERQVLTSNGIKNRSAVVVEKRERMRQQYRKEKKVSDAETREKTTAETKQKKKTDQKDKKEKFVSDAETTAEMNAETNISDAEKGAEIISDAETTAETTISDAETYAESTQSKVKESKEKKSKEKNHPLTPSLQKQSSEDSAAKTEVDEDDEIKKFKKVIHNLHKSGIVPPQGLNFFITEELNDVIDNYGFEDPYDMLNLAIETGAKSGAKRFNYLMAILKDWRRQEFKRREDVNKPAEKGANNKHAGDNEDFKQSWAAALEKRKANRANAF